MQAFKRIKLGQALTFQRGFDITKAEQTRGSIPIVSSSGVSSYHNVAKVDPPGVIIGRKGTLGTVHAVNTPFWPHDTTLWVKDFKGNDPRFLYYFLKTLHLENFDTGSSNPTLNRNHLHKIEVVFPVDVDVQRKIAGILSAYDDLIENNRRRIAILERMAEELYREWFVRMRFPGYQNTKFIKGVPEGWEATNASNLFQIMGGGTPQTENSNYWDGEIPFFTPKDAPDNYVVFDTEKTITPDGLDSCSSRLFPEGTIFITARGTVGKIAIAGCDMAMNQSCYALRPKMQGSDALMFHFLTLRLAVAYFKGMSNSGVFDNIVTDTFKIIPMMWPGEQLIKQFHGFAHPLVSKAARLIQINRHLAQSRNSLLGRLISGKATTDGLDVFLPPSQSLGDDPMTNATELAHA